MLYFRLIEKVGAAGSLTVTFLIPAFAVAWGWLVEKQTPDRWDLLGAAVCLVGMGLIAFGPRR